MRSISAQVGVDDAAQRHLVEVDLLAQDQVQQQVERPLEDGGRHLVRPSHAIVTAMSPPARRDHRTAVEPIARDPRASRASSPPVTSTSATTSGALRNWVAASTRRRSSTASSTSTP